MLVGAPRRRARSRSCWCCSVPSRCCPRPAIASRSCPCSSTSRAACAWRTPTATPGSRGRPRCCASTCCRCCRASSAPSCCLSATRVEPASIDALDRAREPERSCPARWRRSANASAASASRASSCCPTAAIPRRRCRAGRAARRRLALARVRDRRRVRQRVARSRGPRDRGGRSAARGRVGRPAGVGGQQRVRARALSIAGAGRRTAARKPPRGSVRRRIADRAALHRVSRTRGSRPCTPLEIPAGGRRARHREQHAQRPGEPGRTQAPPAGHRGRARVRAHVRQEGMGGRPGLEVDSVVRKGRDVNGSDTLPDSGGGRPCRRADRGFPARREDLYAYDAVVISNVEGGFFTRGQWTMVADFVSERGGGLLVTGGRSFAQRGLVGTPVEAVLPVELDERRGGTSRARRRRSRRRPTASSSRRRARRTRSCGSARRARRHAGSGRRCRRWRRLRRSAAPGRAPSCSRRRRLPAAPCSRSSPCSAYGRGRSMVFGGEASWRWRMMAASTDRSHELFWRQAARWLAEASPDPVAIAGSRRSATRRFGVRSTSTRATRRLRPSPTPPSTPRSSCRAASGSR